IVHSSLVVFSLRQLKLIQCIVYGLTAIHSTSLVKFFWVSGIISSGIGPCCVGLCLVLFDPIFLPMVLAWFRFIE
ncbi:25030_t:CDS:2, partial [Gigaspora rosea]